MLQFGGKPNKSSSSDSKRHFTVIMGGKEHGVYVSSTPSSAAKKAVTKLCASNKSKKVEFHIRETTQGSKKKTYGPYIGYIEKLKERIELKGRIIKYKPVAKLSGKSGSKKGGMIGGAPKALKAPKAPKVPNPNRSVYNINSNNNNNNNINIGNPAAGPAPGSGLYNYVPSNNSSRHSAAYIPEPSAPRLENINRNNNFRNHQEGLVATAPAFDDFNNFNNPAAGPALNRSFAHRGLFNNKNKIEYPFRDPLINRSFVKARNPEELMALVKLINFIEEWKISWNNSKIDDCFDDFLKKFKFSNFDEKTMLLDIKSRLLKYLRNEKSLFIIDRDIKKIISKNPTWGIVLKDNLDKLIDFIKEWKISWNNSNLDDCFDDFFRKFKFPKLDMQPTLRDIKRRLLQYLRNERSLDNIKKDIQKILLKNPTWRRFLKDNNNSSSRSDAVDNTSLSHLLKARSDDIIVLPVDNNIYQRQPQKIPEYHIRNQNPNFVAAKNFSHSWHMYGRPFAKYAIPEDVFDYKQKLKKLAAEMAKNHIFWADRSGTIERSVRFLLEEHYINPTPEQIDTAIKAVRMFLLPTKNRELHRKIIENNFDAQPLSAAAATAAADAAAPITHFEQYQLHKNPLIKKLILTLKAMGLDKNEYKNEVVRRLRSRGFTGRQYDIAYKYLIDSYNN
jgi:hypothetical protein